MGRFKNPMYSQLSEHILGNLLPRSGFTKLQNRARLKVSSASCLFGMWSLEILNREGRKWNKQRKARKNKGNVCYKAIPNEIVCNLLLTGILWEAVCHVTLRVISPQGGGSWDNILHQPLGSHWSKDAPRDFPFQVLLLAEWPPRAGDKVMTCRHQHGKTQVHMGLPALASFGPIC